MSADPDLIVAAHLLLDQLGVSLDDLQHSDIAATAHPSSVPTLASYLPRVIAAAGPTLLANSLSQAARARSRRARWLVLVRSSGCPFQ
jgi:hypothetical protein